jgi:RES domain-containing protein
VTLTAWRIVKRKHTTGAFSGEGARLHGGRWNSPGVRMVYTAANPGLAALEMLVHLNTQDDLLKAYRVIPVEFDESLVETLDAAALPVKWRADPTPRALQRLGDLWVSGRRSAILKVPSAVVPLDSNYLINPDHPDFGRLVIGEVQAFRFDRRLRNRP